MHIYIEICARGLELPTRGSYFVPTLARANARVLARFRFLDSAHARVLARFYSWIVPTLAKYDSFHFSIVPTLQDDLLKSAPLSSLFVVFGNKVHHSQAFLSFFLVNGGRLVKKRTTLRPFCRFGGKSAPLSCLFDAFSCKVHHSQPFCRFFV